MDRDPKRDEKVKTWKRGSAETIRREREPRGRDGGDNHMTFLPGPTPGSKGVVKQHHAMASGYDLPSTPRRVELSQRESSTGDVRVPGFTSRGKR